MENDDWVDEKLFQQFRKHMPIASVDILTLHEGQLLLMLRNNEPGKNLWFVPGGRVRFGETLKHAAIRKLREETGLSAIRIEKKGVMSHFWPQAHYVSTFFVADVADNSVKLNDEHRDYRWISMVGDDIHPYIKDMIEETGILTKNKE